MPTTHDNFWALAPDRAASVFALYHDELELRCTHAEGRPMSAVEAAAATVADHAAAITSHADGVAVIRIQYPLDRTTQTGFFTGRVYALGQDAIRTAIETARESGARAILLSINSPGGVVAGTKELADYIAETAQALPMAAYVDGTAASAAYWLASATGRVLAPATGQVGSIGVVLCLPEYSGFYQRAGISLQYVTSGKYKAAGRDDRPLTDEERAYFEARLAAIHAIFKGDVAAHMHITAPEPQWAEAQVLLGAEAAPLGLVTAVVRDEQAAIATLMEETMSTITLEALTKDAPELLASLKAEGRKEAEAEFTARLAEAGKNGADCALAAMKAVCRKEDVEAVQALLTRAQALGLSAEQLAGVAELFPRAQEQKPVAAQSDHADILAALQQAHADPVKAESTQPNFTSPLVADAQRRAQAAR